MRTAVLVGALALVGCNRQVQVPPPPEAVDRLAPAEDALLAGDYARAVRAYTQFLTEAETAEPEDPLETQQALFRLGLIYMLPDNTARDPVRGHMYLRRVIEESPDSPFAPEIRTILGLEARLVGVQSGLDHLRSELHAMMLEIESVRSKLDTLEIENDRQRAQIATHLMEIAERNERIEAQTHQMERLSEELSQVRAELERMKEIDLSRRPPN